ncbi:MAG: hypothetical protein JXB62_14645 [Pirellulales bacterium]|nr:hypothetical protein [Pirellulales bacterium]
MAHAISQAEIERSPDFWWLRLRYSLRDGDQAGADEARRRLSALGVEVTIRPGPTREGDRGQ